MVIKKQEDLLKLVSDFLENTGRPDVATSLRKDRDVENDPVLAKALEQLQDSISGCPSLAQSQDSTMDVFSPADSNTAEIMKRLAGTANDIPDRSLNSSASDLIRVTRVIQRKERVYQESGHSSAVVDSLGAKAVASRGGNAGASGAGPGPQHSSLVHDPEASGPSQLLSSSHPQMMQAEAAGDAGATPSADTHTPSAGGHTDDPSLWSASSPHAAPAVSGGETTGVRGGDPSASRASLRCQQKTDKEKEKGEDSTVEAEKEKRGDKIGEEATRQIEGATPDEDLPAETPGAEGPLKTNKEKEREFPPASPWLPSEHYKSKRPRALQDPNNPDTEFDVEDEYRDDEDPGYRIRDIYEADLLNELQIKHSVTAQAQNALETHISSLLEGETKPILDDPEKTGGAAGGGDGGKGTSSGAQARSKGKGGHAALPEGLQLPPNLSQCLSNADAVGIALAPHLISTLTSGRIENAPPASNAAAAAGGALESEGEKGPVGDIASSVVDASDELFMSSSPSIAPTQKNGNGKERERGESKDQKTQRTEGGGATPTISLGGSTPRNATEKEACTAERERSGTPNFAGDGEGRSRGDPGAAGVRMTVYPNPNSSKPLPRTGAATGGRAMLAGEGGDGSPSSAVGGEGVKIVLDQGSQELVNQNDPVYVLQKSEAERQSSIWHDVYSAGSHSSHREKKRREREEWGRKRVRRYPASANPFYPRKGDDGATYDCFNLCVIFDRDRTGFEETKDFPVRIGSSIAGRYEVIEYLGSAAFSKAVQAYDRQTERMVCLKVIKNDKDFLDQSLDEVKLLRYLNANADPDEKNVLRLHDCIYHKEHLIIVTELLRDNLYEFAKFTRERGQEPFFTLGKLQRISKQVLEALEYTHSLRLIHCDLKPENILVKSYSKCMVKVIDFGSSCFVDDHLSAYVQSRSYRAPEVMLGCPYDEKIDIWSLGCIIAELWTGFVLFQNESVVTLLARIIGIIRRFPYHMMSRGRYVPQFFTQDGQLYQELDDASQCQAKGRRVRLLVPKKTSLWQRMRTNDQTFLNFLRDCLKVDPAQRPSASELLKHPFLDAGRYEDGL